MPVRPARHRVDIVRDESTQKEMVISSVDLSDTIQGGHIARLDVSSLR
jgi:hypothetical protein